MGKWFVVMAYVSVLGFAPLVQTAIGAVAWDEAINGDLSNNGLAPAAVVLGAGTHSLLGSTQSGDLDYISVKIPVGQQFTQFILHDYESTDFTAFIAVQAGSTFTAAPPIPPVASLLGYSHFGPNASFGARVGDDMMYALGTAAGAIGFNAPLPAGDYTFWIQQTGALTEYEFDFVVVPEPATAVSALVAMVFFAPTVRQSYRAGLRSR